MRTPFLAPLLIWMSTTSYQLTTPPAPLPEKKRQLIESDNINIFNTNRWLYKGTLWETENHDGNGVLQRPDKI